MNIQEVIEYLESVSPGLTVGVSFVGEMPHLKFTWHPQPSFEVSFEAMASRQPISREDLQKKLLGMIDQLITGAARAKLDLIDKIAEVG